MKVKKMNLRKDSNLIRKQIDQKEYDLWLDNDYDNYDYEAEIKREYKELGYNPREVIPVGKELRTNM